MARRPKQNKQEDYMASALDHLSQFEEFERSVLPLLKQAIREGWSAEKIEKHPKIAAMLVARQITMALTELDSAKALSAIKDTRDRSAGKAIERREVKHQLESLPDEQLDARLKTLLDEEAEEDDEVPHVTQ